MYLCSCKGLTDTKIREIAGQLAIGGIPRVDSLMLMLQLDDEDACGLCASAPEYFIELAVTEWTLLGVSYEDGRLNQ